MFAKGSTASVTRDTGAPPPSHVQAATPATIATTARPIATRARFAVPGRDGGDGGSARRAPPTKCRRSAPAPPVARACADRLHLLETGALPIDALHDERGEPRRRLGPLDVQLFEDRRFAKPMRTHAHHAHACHAPWKREGENVSSGQSRADAFRRSQAPARRLLTGQLCASLLERRAALGQQFRIVALPDLEVGASIEDRQRPIADAGVEAAER